MSKTAQEVGCWWSGRYRAGRRNLVKHISLIEPIELLQVLVGQPFDIVKVRIQTAPRDKYKGMLDCAEGVWKEGGIRAFYKGTMAPLLGIAAYTSIQFGVYNHSKRIFKNINLEHNRYGPQGDVLSDSQLLASGALAGLTSGIISGPIEHIRIRLQTQPADKPQNYTGPWDAVKKIYAKRGIAGIYKGQAVTFSREVPGCAVYFWVFERLVQREVIVHHTDRDELHWGKTFSFGAVAGLVSWIASYPMDVIKSRIQTDGFSSTDGRKYRSALDCIRTVWRDEGRGAFVRGLRPALIRSPLANGATFLSEGTTRRFLGRSDHYLNDSDV